MYKMCEVQMTANYEPKDMQVYAGVLVYVWFCSVF